MCHIAQAIACLLLRRTAMASVVPSQQRRVN
jgi:hypothetical protein